MEQFAPINRTQLARDIAIAKMNGKLNTPGFIRAFVERNYPREHWAEVKALFKKNRKPSNEINPS